jgi:hypothetical protein
MDLIRVSSQLKMVQSRRCRRMDIRHERSRSVHACGIRPRRAAKLPEATKWFPAYVLCFQYKSSRALAFRANCSDCDKSPPSTRTYLKRYVSNLVSIFCPVASVLLPYHDKALPDQGRHMCFSSCIRYVMPAGLAQRISRLMLLDAIALPEPKQSIEARMLLTIVDCLHML